MNGLNNFCVVLFVIRNDSSDNSETQTAFLCDQTDRVLKFVHLAELSKSQSTHLALLSNVGNRAPTTTVHHHFRGRFLRGSLGHCVGVKPFFHVSCPTLLADKF